MQNQRPVPFYGNIQTVNDRINEIPANQRQAVINHFHTNLRGDELARGAVRMDDGTIILGQWGQGDNLAIRLLATAVVSPQGQVTALNASQPPQLTMRPVGPNDTRVDSQAYTTFAATVRALGQMRSGHTPPDQAAAGPRSSNLPPAPGATQGGPGGQGQGRPAR
jgi:hypothetical protein